jgi:hypothetical protein
MIARAGGLLAQGVEGAPGAWLVAKTFIEHMIGFSHDALHVLVGVGLQLLLAAVLRDDMRGWRPWLGVVLLELANEGADLFLEVWPDHAMQWGESAKDVALTMALPTVLMVVSRHWPRLLVRCAPAPSDHIAGVP